jgi:cysteine-rich repeat protein
MRIERSSVPAVSRWLSVLVLLLPGCPSTSTDPIDGGSVDSGAIFDAPPRDAPGADSPGADAPGADSPGADAPGADAPGVDAPGTDAPGTDAFVATATCGNGTVEGSEQCDDGATLPGDGCDALCAFEPTPMCGDGTLDPGEQCDDDGIATGDGCDDHCRNETPATCGDGTIQVSLGEECDDTNLVSGDGCSGSCQLEPASATCGDGTLDAGEVCDDGNTLGGDTCNATCNLANTTTLFAGMPGVTGRADGIGTAASFTGTSVMAVDDRYIWLAESPGMGGTPPSVLRRIEIATADVVTIGTIGGSGGVATNGVDTVWVAGGNVIQSVSTSAPYTITTIHSGVAATSAANFVDGAPGTASFSDVRGLTWYAGYLWIVDTAAAVIRRMDPATGNVTTVAGTPYATPAVGVDGIGSAARFTSPRYIVSDGSGLLYISDTNGAAIRAMHGTTFSVTTVAGVPGTAGYVDGVGATVRVHRPRGITADASSVYFCEFNMNTIRQVITSTGAVSTVVGTPSLTTGYAEGVGPAAVLNAPWGIVYHHPTRSLFFSEANHTIRRIQ